MLAQFVLGVLPGGPIAGHEDEIGEVGLFGFLFQDGVEGFDGLAVGTPVGAVLVLVTGDEDEGFCRGLDELVEDGFKLG